MDELLCMIHLSSLFFLDVDYLSFFLLTCLVGMWHTFFGYASFISFCIAHILDDNLVERVMIELGVLLDGNALLSSSVEV